MKNYKDTDMWKCAILLYEKSTPLFFSIIKHGSYKFYNQIESSCGSISDNIAEGFGRMGNKEIIQFMAYANGSCMEFENQIYRAKILGFLEEESFQTLLSLVNSISKQIIAFIKYMQSVEFKGTKFK